MIASLRCSRSATLISFARRGSSGSVDLQLTMQGAPCPGLPLLAPAEADEVRPPDHHQRDRDGEQQHQNHRQVQVADDLEGHVLVPRERDRPREGPSRRVDPHLVPAARKGRQNDLGVALEGPHLLRAVREGEDDAGADRGPEEASRAVKRAWKEMSWKAVWLSLAGNKS